MDVRGRAFGIHVFDVGVEIDLDAAASRLPEARRERAVRHLPQGFAGSRQVPEVLTWQERQPPPLDDLRLDPDVELRVYAFGAVVVTYSMPVEAPAASLVDLARAFHLQSSLRPDGLARTRKAARAMGDAVAQPDVSELGEGYLVFEVIPEGPRADFWEAEAATVVQALRVGRTRPTAGEVRDTLGDGDGERTLAVDWFGALLVGEGREEERRVLELALAELLELQILDGRLDRLLHEAHRALRRSRHLERLGFGSRRLDLIARMQVDAALHFEGVENAVRFLGNRYLVRVYQLAEDRLQLERWSDAVLRKVDTLDAVYAKLSDRMSHLPGEALQWVVIVLITISLAVSLWRLG